MINMLLYVGFIILADVLAARWIISLPFGLFVPAGVFVVAPIFTLRDSIHHKYGVKIIVILIFLASILSYSFSVIFGNTLLGKVTIASVIAFLVSEYSDTLIYHLTRHQTWMNRVLKSNAVSTLLDSVIFIGLAFGLILPLIIGQYIVKMIIAGITGLILLKKNSNEKK